MKRSEVIVRLRRRAEIERADRHDDTDTDAMEYAADLLAAVEDAAAAERARVGAALRALLENTLVTLNAEDDGPHKFWRCELVLHAIERVCGAAPAPGLLETWPCGHQRERSSLVNGRYCPVCGAPVRALDQEAPR